MDQMIDQIQCIMERKGKLDEDGVQAVASYLMGQTPFQKVRHLLHTSNDHYYRLFYRHMGEIASACKSTPALLPRLGRHLYLLEYAFPNIYHNMLRQLHRGGLTLEQLFLDSELGPDRLLHYIYVKGSLAAVSGTSGDILALLARQHPDALRQFAEEQGPPTGLPAQVYLCAHTDKAGRRLEKGLDENLITCAAAAAKLWGYGAPSKLKEHLQELDPKLAKLCGKVESAAKRMDDKACQLCAGSFFHALVLSEFKLPSMNLIAKAACQADYRRFLGQLAGTLAATRPVNFPLNNHRRQRTGKPEDIEKALQSIREQLDQLSDWLKAMDISEAYLCAFTARETQWAPDWWLDIHQERYGQTPALLKAAAGIARFMERGALLHSLHGLGEPLEQDTINDLVEGLLFFLTQPHYKKTNVEPVAQYLRGERDTDPSLLPSMKEFYDSATGYYIPNEPAGELDWLIWTFWGLSPVADRYLRYHAGHGRYFQIEHCLLFLLRYHRAPVEQVTTYITQTVGAGAAIAAIASQNIKGSSRNSALTEPILKAIALQEPRAMEEAVRSKGTDAETRLYLLEQLCARKDGVDGDLLIEFLGDSSKRVRQLVMSCLLPRKELIEKIRPLAQAKKKVVREQAEQLLLAYEGGDDSGGGGADNADLMAYCTRSLPNSWASSLRWAFPDGAPPVRCREADEEAAPAISRCYFYTVLTAKSMDYTPAMARIREGLREEDLRQIAAQVYGQWLAQGAPAKNKAALLLLGLHAGGEEILMLQRQIDDWSKSSRGAIASEAVKALALNGSDLALMTVDTLSRRAKNKQVRRVGGEAFAAAAKALNTTPEALGDRIIPNLGFDGRGEKVVDYGTRRFIATLSPSLTIQLRTEEGKTIKSLPKPGAKDDVPKAEAAKAEFTALKKSLKAVVGTQTERLEQALSTARYWTKEAWQKLFVHNPIMHSFAIGLVWGVYEKGALTGTFRYMEDGSFTTVDEEDFDFEGVTAGEIGLVHPLDLDPDLLSAWQEQLADYEIAQPLIQLDRPLYRLEGAESAQLVLDRFGGKRMLGITLVGKLQKAGWYKGSVQDAGCFYTFYKEVGDIGVQLYFSGMYVSPDPDETITVGQVGFYRAGSVDRGSYVYDDVKKETCIPLKDIPDRLFSETILELTAATASSTETDEGWNKETELLFFNGK